jgi:hypothetical protein
MKKLQPLTGFVLILAFLLLSYCPLRRAIQDLIKGKLQPTEQAKTKGSRPVSQICLGFVNSANEKLILSQPESEIRTPLVVISLVIFYFIWSSLAVGRVTLVQIYFSRTVSSPVPLYLKNRRLLI